MAASKLSSLKICLSVGSLPRKAKPDSESVSVHCNRHQFVESFIVPSTSSLRFLIRVGAQSDSPEITDEVSCIPFFRFHGLT